MPLEIKTYSIEFQGYWRDCNKSGIPSQSGVYLVYRCIYNEETDTVSLKQIIYIGQSENVHDRIRNHEKAPEFSAKLGAGEELCYSFAPVDSLDLNAIEHALIFAQKPPLNEEHKESYDCPPAIFKVDGKCSGLKYTEYKIS